MQQHIAVILGHDAVKLNSYTPSHLIDGFKAAGADVSVALGGTGPFHRQSVDGTIDRLMQNKGPKLLFGILNGRTHSPGFYPQNVHGGGADLNDMMNRLVTEANKNGEPVDIFLLLASSPRFIHGHVQKLPRGSTIVAFETSPQSRDSTHFWGMLEHKPLHQALVPDIRNLTLYALLGCGPSFGLPEIAISGQPLVDVRDVWADMITAPRHGQLCVSDPVRDELRGISRFMSQPQADDLEYVMRTINAQPHHVKPLDNKYYACAVASLWRKYFTRPGPAMAILAPPAASAPAVVKRAPVPSSGGSAAPAPQNPANPPASAQRPRLTNSQVGGLYKPGKPLHQQHPAVVRRLLRRG